MRKMLLLTVQLVIMGGVYFPDTAVCQAIPNTQHLESLFRTFSLKGSEVGAIQIYSEFPDYRWVGDEDEGDVCIDDAARALVFYCRQHRHQSTVELKEKIRLLTRFLIEMQAENGLFYNFARADGSINRTHVNSEPRPSFWSWRAFWGLTEVLLLQDASLADEQVSAGKSIQKLLPHIDQLCQSKDTMMDSNGILLSSCLAELGGDQASVILMALSNYYETTIGHDPATRHRIARFADLITTTQAGSTSEFPYGAFLSWRHIWHAWGNSQSYALLRASQVTGEKRFASCALEEINGFYPYVLKQNHLSYFAMTGLPGGHRLAEEIKSFPKIAYGVRPMVFACMLAFEMTGEEVYLQRAADLAAWLFGKNAGAVPMYDPSTGRVFDGMEKPGAINRNSGAESTIEGLLTIQCLASHKKGAERIRSFQKNLIKK